MAIDLKANLSSVFALEREGAEAQIRARALYLVTKAASDQLQEELPPLDDHQRAWIAANGFDGSSGKALLVPTSDNGGGELLALLGIGEGHAGEPCGPNLINIGRGPAALPEGTYRLMNRDADATLAAVAWGLGAYRFDAFKARCQKRARLAIPETAHRVRVEATVDACHLGRNMINAPANELGPEEIAAVVSELAGRFGAEVTIARGEDSKFEENFPLVAAVGRASPRAPRLIDLTWGRPDAPKVTLVGKGICFDTGGLDLKPAAAMLLMKKDMGGAAAAIAAAAMIMAFDLPVRLRLVVAAAENSVAGNAFRPGDVIRSRAGTSVEIGNTDAEGRLVLADALTYADEDAPDVMMTFATLTGAARVALGAELPAMFSTDDDLADRISRAGLAMGDPVWRMPFWHGYDRLLASQTADMSNVSEGPFGGSITAALFLKRFVKSAKAYAHFDLYGWRQATRSLGPKGGEVHTSRAVVAAIEDMLQHGQA